MDSQNPALKLEVFEGPLDLLLHLIEKNKIDIYDIPIFEITRQYLDYLKQWDDLNMEVASEFIVMAAVLINIKARRLLPIAERGDEEEDEEALLLARLLEYRRYKEAGAALGEYIVPEYRQIWWRTAEPIQGERPIPTVPELLDGIEISRLHDICLAAERAKKESYDTIRAQFKTVRKEQFTVSEKISGLRRQLALVEKLSFLELKASSRTKEEGIAYFMAMLELSRMGQVSLNQRKSFGDIIIKAKQNTKETEVPPETAGTES